MFGAIGGRLILIINFFVSGFQSSICLKRRYSSNYPTVASAAMPEYSGNRPGISPKVTILKKFNSIPMLAGGLLTHLHFIERVIFRTCSGEK